MGKKAKSSIGKAKAEQRKLDKSTLPPPPPPPEEEVRKKGALYVNGYITTEGHKERQEINTYVDHTAVHSLKVIP